MSDLLRVEDLETCFYSEEGVIKALSGVSFGVQKGKTLGLVGESGCGKSVTAKSILRILGPRGRIVNGKILFHMDGETVDLAELTPNGSKIRAIRGKEIAMIFQEPMTSLSPVHSIGSQITEAVLLHQNVDQSTAKEIAVEMLRKTGIPKPEQRFDQYPHHFSGGMRQRAMIAMALCCRPKLLIADEPTTALDVTIQAQILDLMKSAQEELGTAIMIITHNLGVISEIADEVVVMYLGRVVERATVKELFRNPLHPYTRGLLKAIPRIGQRFRGKLEPIEGAVPDAYSIPTGCAFHPRCPEFRPGVCDKGIPNSLEVSKSHHVACFCYSEELPDTE